MALKSFLILYPDKSKAHVTAKEREQMLLRGQIRHVVGNQYEWITPALTLHSMAELSKLSDMKPYEHIRRYLPGQFVFQLQDKRQRELLETPEAMALRMSRC